MRRAAGSLAALAALALAAAPAQAASGTLTPGSGAVFPQRSFVLTLPQDSAVSPGSIAVTEGGRPVLGLRAKPLGSRFGVILAIDTSGSMRGAPIRGALAAARAFAAQRPAYQPLGVITFSDTAQVAVPFTTDAAAIRQGLAGAPKLRPYTHIYDAVESSLAAIKSEHLAGGAVVVLSDGHDHGSTATPGALGRAARRAGVRLITVGIQSPDFDPSNLHELAAAGGGDYVGAASSAALVALYRDLGNRLSNAYVVRYRSTAAAGSNVAVTAVAGQVRATTGYHAPSLSVPGAVAPTHRSKASSQPFAATGGGRLLITLAIALLAGGAVAAVTRYRRQATAFRDRVASYGGGGAPEHAGLPAEEEFGPAARARLAERSPWLVRIENALELARMDISAERFVAIVAGLALLAAVLVWLLVGVLLALAAAVVVVLGARTYVRRKITKLRTAFADQLAETVSAVASAMRTGHSFAGSLSQATEHAPEPTASEIQRAVAAERLGVPIEQALAEVGERMKSRDVGQVGLVAVLQRETGGNGAEALDRVVENVRARDDLRRLLRTLTAQGKIAQRVLTGLPIVTLGLASLASDAFKPLFTTTAGHIALAAAAALVMGGAVWIRKIVNIEA
jgi:tight adherence protein B